MPTLFSKLVFALAFAALPALANVPSPANQALAPQISLAPAVLQAPGNATTQSVSVRNLGKTSIRFQVEVRSWTQTGGKDLSQPTRAAFASPRIVEIPAGSTRAINLSRLGGTGPAYFRLLLRQLPVAGQPKGTLDFLTNHNLSVAFEDTSKEVPPLEARSAPGGYMLTNTGRTATRVSALGPEGAKPWSQGTLGWVLPGQSKFFAAPAVVPVLSVRLLTQTVSLRVQ